MSAWTTVNHMQYTTLGFELDRLLLVRTDKFEMAIVLKKFHASMRLMKQLEYLIKLTQNAKDKIKRLNADCNLKAGLEAVLQITVGGHVMLHRNIDRVVWPNKKILCISCALSPDLPLVSVMMISAVAEPRLTPVLVVERTI